RPLPNEMEAQRILHGGRDKELEDALAVPELSLEVFVDVVLQVGRDQLEPVVIPVGIDPDQQVSLFPINRVSVDVAFTGAWRVEPKTDKAILPNGRDGIFCAGDQPGVRGSYRLPIQRLTDPDLALFAVVEPDGRVLAVEFVGAELCADARPIPFFAFAKAE